MGLNWKCNSYKNWESSGVQGFQRLLNCKLILFKFLYRINTQVPPQAAQIQCF